nr:MAG TPA: ASCH domain protein [Caudoviricetes sp.]
MSMKPILFNTDMVKAILDGRKSCTRRVVKPQPTARYGTQCIKPPYQQGDILYIRETWERFECWNCDGDERGNCPKEPKKSVLDKACGCYMYRATDEISGDAKWHPSLHMPKEAARIFLRVTNVRVERLRDITVEDALAEGMDKYIRLNGELDENSIITSFIGVWNSTIKKSNLDSYGWNANPWVWVIEFERCDKPESKVL